MDTALCTARRKDLSDGDVSYWRSGCVLARCPEVRVHEMNESTRWHPVVPLYNFTLFGVESLCVVYILRERGLPLSLI